LTNPRRQRSRCIVQQFASCRIKIFIKITKEIDHYLTMRSFFLFLALICSAQALFVPFQRFTGGLVRVQSSSHRMEMVSSSSQMCSMSGMMSSCSCASCRSSSSSRQQRVVRTNRLRTTALKMSAVMPDPTPGSPVLKNVDKATNIAVMSIALSGEQTQVGSTPTHTNTHRHTPIHTNRTDD
jgi:hypothetical protein